MILVFEGSYGLHSRTEMVEENYYIDMEHSFLKSLSKNVYKNTGYLRLKFI